MPTATRTRKTSATKNSSRQTQKKNDAPKASTHHVVPFDADQHSYELRDIPLSQIIVPEGRREPKDVNTLATSIQEIGLLHPITVIEDEGDMYRLVSGRNRISAHLKLGRTHIPCHVVSLDALHAEIAEIDENIIRNELTALASAESFKRRKELHEQLHPETKRGGAPGKAGGGKMAKNPESGHFVVSFLDETAEKTGRGRSTIAESVQIATNLDDDVKHQLQGTPIEDRKTDLLRLARMSQEEQQEIVTAIVNESCPTVAQATQFLRELGNPNFAKKPAKKKSLYDSVGMMGFLEEVKDYAYRQMEQYKERDTLSHEFDTQNGKVILVITLQDVS